MNKLILNEEINKETLERANFIKCGRKYVKKKVLYSCISGGKKYPLILFSITVDLDEMQLTYLIVDENDRLYHEFYRGDNVNRNDVLKSVCEKYEKELYFLKKDKIAVDEPEEILAINKEVEENVIWSLYGRDYKAGDKIIIRYKTKSGDVKELKSVLRYFDLKREQVVFEPVVEMTRIGFQIITAISFQ